MTPSAEHRPPVVRWSDEKLEEFYQEFIAHRLQEDADRQKQQAMYDALFRKEDADSNVAPGIVQLMVRTAEDVKVLRIAADRQKTFIGGMLFAITSLWFFFTDIGPELVKWVKTLAK